MDLLRAGIERSELANTVSPGYAAEALTPDYGMGLDATLRHKAAQPAPTARPASSGSSTGSTPSSGTRRPTSTSPARYSAGDLAGKAACRADLLARHGMDPDDPGPVLGMIGRLDPQKGFDILADAAPALVELGARIIVQGSGDAHLADPFRALAAAHPESVALVERFDRANARRIYAGSDLFLMPSRFEPCGQGQMIALRYGTPPLVRRTGGLGDTVIDASERPGEGTGFVFDDPTPAALMAACRRAFAVRGRDGSTDGWLAIVERGMALDFGWDTGSAPRYALAYRRAVELRQVARLGVAGQSTPRARRSARVVASIRVRCGECSPSAIVRMWSAPTRSASRGSQAAGVRLPVASSPRTIQTGIPASVGSPSAAREASQSPFPSRTAIAAAGTTSVSDSALTSCSSAGQSGFVARTDASAPSSEVAGCSSAIIASSTAAVHDRRVEQDDPRRAVAGRREAGRQHRSPAVPDDRDVIGAVPRERVPGERGDHARGLVEREPEPVVAAAGPAVAGQVRRHDPEAGRRERRTEPPERPGRRDHAVDEEERAAVGDAPIERGEPDPGGLDRRPLAALGKARAERIASAAAGGRSSSVARIGAGNEVGVGAVTRPPVPWVGAGSRSVAETADRPDPSTASRPAPAGGGRLESALFARSAAPRRMAWPGSSSSSSRTSRERSPSSPRSSRAAGSTCARSAAGASATRAT